MKVKIFKIRVSEEFLESDQELINNFLAQSEVLHTNSKLIEEEINYWSVLISYEEKKLKNSSSKADRKSVV